MGHDGSLGLVVDISSCMPRAFYHQQGRTEVGSGAATKPALSKSDFIERGSDIYKEEKKKSIYLDGQSANGSDI